MPRPLFSMKHFGFSIFVAFAAITPLSSFQAQTPAVANPCTASATASQVLLSGIVSDPSGAILHDALVTLSCGAVKQETLGVTQKRPLVVT